MIPKDVNGLLRTEKHLAWLQQQRANEESMPLASMDDALVGLELKARLNLQEALSELHDNGSDTDEMLGDFGCDEACVDDISLVDFDGDLKKVFDVEGAVEDREVRAGVGNEGGNNTLNGILASSFEAAVRNQKARVTGTRHIENVDMEVVRFHLTELALYVNLRAHPNY